jgi:hypothetical protein
VGEVYWVIRGLHWKIIFFVISCFFLTQINYWTPLAYFIKLLGTKI